MQSDWKDRLITVLYDNIYGQVDDNTLLATAKQLLLTQEAPQSFMSDLDADVIEKIMDEWPDHSKNYGREFMRASAFKAKYAMGSDDWVWDTLLPRGEVIALVGARGEGKTFLALGASIAASQGIDFGPFKSSGRKQTVLYITEESLGGIAKRISNYQQRWGISDDDLDTWFYLMPVVHQLIANGNGREPVIKAQEIFNMIRSAQHRGELPQIDLVVIDYFRRAVIDANENDNGHIAKALRGAYDIAKTLNAGILVVHHKGKNQDGGPRGASVFGDFVYAVLVSEGGDLAMVEETSSGDLLFIDASKETNKVGASLPGAKQPKEGKVDDYFYCLVKQKHSTVVFLDPDDVTRMALDVDDDTVEGQLRTHLMMTPGQAIPRKELLNAIGCSPGTLTAAWNKLSKSKGHWSEISLGGAGNPVAYRYG